MSPHTVITHKRNAQKKLDADNAVQTVAEAIRRGFIR